MLDCRYFHKFTDILLHQIFFIIVSHFEILPGIFEIVTYQGVSLDGVQSLTFEMCSELKHLESC